MASHQNFEGKPFRLFSSLIIDQSVGKIFPQRMRSAWASALANSLTGMNSVLYVRCDTFPTMTGGCFISLLTVSSSSRKHHMMRANCTRQV